MIVGATVRTIRTRHAASLPIGLIYGLVSGGTIGAATAGCIATLQTILCRPVSKGGYVIPDWSFWLGPCLVLFAAGLGARLAVSRTCIGRNRPRRVFVSVVIWTITSGLLTALALTWFGFSGYPSNEPPMLSALTGFVFGGGGALTFILLGELLLQLERRSAVPRA